MSLPKGLASWPRAVASCRYSRCSASSPTPAPKQRTSAAEPGGRASVRIGGRSLAGSKQNTLSSTRGGRRVNSAPICSATRSATSISAGESSSGAQACSISSRSSSCVALLATCWAAWMRTSVSAQPACSDCPWTEYASFQAAAGTAR